MKNKEQQSLVQVVLAIANAGSTHPPAAISESNVGNEVGIVAGTSQQLQLLQYQIRGNQIESDDE